MFRFSTYAKLGRHNLRIIGKCGQDFSVISGSFSEMTHHFIHQKAVGFYFQFPAKYHPIAYAFFCTFSNLPDFLRQFCPVMILLQLSKRGLLSRKIFPGKTISRPIMNDYLRFTARRAGALDQNKFTPLL